jgi:organic hydroperoxide reductase OsmC/OhrA
MTNIVATVAWQRGADETFTDKRFSRGHQWSFDGGLTVRASSSPQVVPKFSDPAGVDPEEAFVASLSACHMLTFLWVAAGKGFTIDGYVDEASGVLGKNAKGKSMVTAVTLRPKVVFSGDLRPDAAALEAMHHAAHEDCFIANSVTTEVRWEPVF